MKQLNYILALFLLLAAISCEQRSQYEQILEQEARKGVRHDTLFLGYSLGMDRGEFLQHSWDLNQKQVITGAAQVEYHLTDLSHNARMVFYPEFNDNRIYKMPIEISFSAWAPWNRHLFSDSLISELVDHFERIYGPGFIKARPPDLNREAWIKIDGNRRILIYRHDDMIARVEFLDLSVANEK